MVNGLWPLVSVSVISGIGGGFYAPTAKAAIAALASAENQTTAFSVRGIAANIGTSLAGLAALSLAVGPARGLFFVTGAIHVGLALLTWTMVPRDCGERPCQIPKPGAMKEVLANRPFLVFSLVAVAIWTLYAQLALAILLQADGIGAAQRNISLIWTVNSLIVILLQTPVTRFVISRLHPLTATALGVVFMGIDLGSVAWATQFFHLFLSAAVFTVGEMLIIPTLDSTVSQLSRPETVGVYFGIANFFSGLGDGLENFSGGQMLERPGCSHKSRALSSRGRWQPLRQALRQAEAVPGGPRQAPAVRLFSTTRPDTDKDAVGLGEKSTGEE